MARHRETPYRTLSVLVISRSPELATQVEKALAEEDLLGAEVLLLPSRNDVAARTLGPQGLVIVDSGAEDACWLAGRMPEATVILIARPEDMLLKASIISSGVIDLPSSPNSREHSLSPFMVRTICYHGLRQQNRLLIQSLSDIPVRSTRLLPMHAQSSPFDPRTGWHTHAHIVDRCQEEIVRATRYSFPISLAMIDFTGYEEIETEHGEAFASEMMTQLAQRLRAVSRHCDVAGHYGVSSFLVILTNTDIIGGKRFCERINQAFLPPITIDSIPINLVWSTAIVARPEGHSTTPTDLLNHLERRMERARRLGTRGIVVAD